MGRKPAGEKKLWNAEKQKRYCEKNKEILKEKDKQAKKEKKQIKFMKDFLLLHKEKVKQEPNRRKERR